MPPASASVPLASPLASLAQMQLGPFHVALEVREVEVRVVTLQQPLVCQCLQLWECNMPGAKAKTGSRAVVPLASPSPPVVSTTTIAGTHLSTSGRLVTSARLSVSQLGWLPQQSWLLNFS